MCTAALMVFVISSCKDKEPVTECRYGSQLTDEELKPVLKSANRMVSLVEDGDFGGLYDLGTEYMKKHQSRDQFVFALDMFKKVFGSVEYSRPEEAYMMSSEAEEERVWIPCNLGKPGVNDMWGMPANEELAAVIYKSRTDLELVRVVLHLKKEEGEWRLRHVSLHPATIKHNTYEYYVKRALKARENNQLHLAVLYYKTAILLSDIGLNVDEFTVRTLTEQMKQLKVDYMPEGQVQLWSTDSGETYKVYKIDVAYDNGSLMVQVNYLTGGLKDKERLDKEARDIAMFLDKKFPQYRKGFDGVMVTAASEKKEEALAAHHTSILYQELGSSSPDKGEESSGQSD